jgi:ABC-2 type transport system permease protein
VNRRRTFAITKRVLRGVRHDRRSMGLMVVAPIMAMFVFGIAFAGDVTDVPVAVAMGDIGYILGPNNTLSVGQEIVDHLDTRVLHIIPVGSDFEAVAMVERGEARAALIIPWNLSADIYNAMQGRGNNTPTILLRLDRSNVNIASTIASKVASAIRDAVQDFGRAPFALDDSQAIYGKDAKFADFFIPGVMTFAVFLITNLLTITGFVQERLSGTIDRLGASPLTPGELVIGYGVAYSMMALVQAAILLTVAILAFQITIVGSVVIAFAIIALLAIASQALGILLSAAARTEAQAVQFIPFLVFPVFLLSGIFWPVEAIPPELRPFSWIVPPTYAVEGLRDVMVRGWGLEHVWWVFAALGAFSILFIVAARFSLVRSRA